MRTMFGRSAAAFGAGKGRRRMSDSEGAGGTESGNRMLPHKKVADGNRSLLNTASMTLAVPGSTSWRGTKREEQNSRATEAANVDERTTNCRSEAAGEKRTSSAATARARI